ncbi:MAG: response regulator [Leptospiraceae bacterium]|nr:response regulator [Leptospiraceae bacterium]
MNKTAKQSSVLVVDDIDSIRGAIVEYIQKDFITHEAADGFEALKILAKEDIQFLITDIRMPGMSGLQLCKLSMERFPGVQPILMTAYNPDDYIRFAREFGIWNLIPKSTALNLEWIRVMLKKLEPGVDIFGIEHYFPGTPVEKISLGEMHRIHRHKRDSDLINVFFQIQITNHEEHNTISDMIGDFLIEQGSPSSVRMILEELSANAIIHAPRVRQRIRDLMLQEQQSGSNEHAGRDDVSLEQIGIEAGDAFDMCFGILNRHTVFSIKDRHGAFNKVAALNCLERQTSLDPGTGLPIGLADYHGRGLYISREQLDQLIFNITPQAVTEIIGILNMQEELRSRAISIFESQPVGTA